jgi:hypothetical protein
MSHACCKPDLLYKAEIIDPNHFKPQALPFGAFHHFVFDVLPGLAHEHSEQVIHQQQLSLRNVQEREVLHLVLKATSTT